MNKRDIYLISKKFFDFISSLIVSIIIFVPFIVISLIIIIKDPGNPFYMQERVGQYGKKIKVLKFRSMKKNADNLEKYLSAEQIKEYKKEYKLNDDPRLIGYKKNGDGKKCFGAMLRKFSLDEIPQIFYNILLVGNMSVIGPRPVLKDELCKNYNKDEIRKFLSVKPGLTGYWQAYGRNNVGYKNHKRQDMELFYIENQSAWLDIKILFRTVYAVIKKNGAK